MPTTRERPWSPADHQHGRVDPVAIVLFLLCMLLGSIFIVSGVVAQSMQSDECWHGMRIGTDESCVQHVERTNLHRPY